MRTSSRIPRISGGASRDLPPVKFGFCTDLHYADRPTSGANTRYYRDAPDKLGDIVEALKDDTLSFFLFCGDLIDHAGLSKEQAKTDLEYIESVFAAINQRRRFVFGNHCLDALSKSEFMEHVPMEAGYYSWDIGGMHFVVLDACYYDDDDDAHYDSGNFVHTDTWIPPAQRSWLVDDLAATDLPTIVFCHQRLSAEGGHWLNNAAQVRGILASSGRLIGVFDGHSHVNAYEVVNGIPFYTMMAATEDPYPTNAWAVITVYPSTGVIEVDGRGQQTSY